MPGPINYSAIALLARDRLRTVHASLNAKVHDRGGTDLEWQVAYLAGKAYGLMNAGAPMISPPLRLYGPPASDQVSKFLFMGAAGPEIPSFAAAYAPLQRWIRDTMHKGTPDEHHEQVLSYSTDFLFAFWRSVKAEIARLPTAAERSVATAQMQSYVLGHCCHIAADVVSGPYVDALEGRLGGAAWQKLTRAQIVADIENEASRIMFNGVPRAGRGELDHWWPDPPGIPRAFYKAFNDALTEVYGLQGRRGGGVFESARARHAPPVLSEQLLEDGYRTFRVVLGYGQSWTFLEWLGFTGPMFLPALIALPIAAYLPAGKDAFREPRPAGLDEDAAVFQAIAFPFAANSLMPLAYSIGIAASPLGAEAPVVFGIVSGAVQVVAGLTFALTTDGGGALRWLLLFALPLTVEIAFIVFALTRLTEDNPRRTLLVLGGIMHIAIGAIFALLFRAFLHLAVEALNDGDTGRFFGLLMLWLLILGALWVITTLIMRAVSGTDPVAPTAVLDTIPPGVPGTALPRSHVQLFDETMLSACGPPSDVASPAARFFPPGRRPLLKLWWGEGDAPTLLVFRGRLEFAFGATVRKVYAPSAPTRLAEFATLLEHAVKNAANETGLTASPFYPDQAEFDDCVLPPGVLFSDHGDTEATQLGHDRVSATPLPVGTDQGSAFVLYAAPRTPKAVRYSREGPIGAAAARQVSIRGVGTLTSNPARTVLTKTAGGELSMPALFAPVDFVEAPFGVPGAPRRRVVSVDSDTQITVAPAFPAALVGVAYGRVIVTAAAGTLSSHDSPHANIVKTGGANATRLTTLFRPGDVVEAPFGTDGAPRRVVVSVDSDEQMTVSAPFPAALLNVAFGRLVRGRGEDEFVPATWRVAAGVSTNLAEAPLAPGGELLAGKFRPGDRIELTPAAGPAQTTVVTEVFSDTEMRLAVQLDPGPMRFRRLGGEDETLHRYTATIDDTLLSGRALMNEAADLAVMLCLGMTTHLLPPAQLDRRTVGGNTSLAPVYQMFRNWNLDRRRVNEWKMLVLGGAVSEKAGDPDDPDFAMGAVPPGWHSSTPEGEATANRIGWIPAFRRWMDMAGRPDVDVAAGDSFRAGTASNFELSEAMAFLLDQLAPPAH